MQIATIFEEQGKLNDSFKYAVIASDAYGTIYGKDNELSIVAQWLKLSISYALKHDNIIDQCKNLYTSLTMRDQALAD